MILAKVSLFDEFCHLGWGVILGLKNDADFQNDICRWTPPRSTFRGNFRGL